MTLKEVENFIHRVNQQQENKGYTLWAIELKATADLIGFIGLNYTDFPAHFTPAIGIGWRIGSQYWCNGYATEGAKAVLDYGFNKINLEEIVAFTVPDNLRSIKVMERLGMLRDLEGDFNHPKLSATHKLSKHVLYHLTTDQYHDYIKNV